MNLNKPYNYRELEKLFPEQHPRVVRKRIARISKKLKALGYEEVGDRSDGRICFVKLEPQFSSCVSFGLWQIRHETDADFEFGFNRFFSWFPKRKGMGGML